MTADPPAGSHERFALIVASSDYEDTTLRRLVAPPRDAESLARVLEDPDIGGFDVTTLTNSPSFTVAERIEGFFQNRRPGNLLLLYFSGHGIKDADGRLYFATVNTRSDRLRATAIPAGFLHDVMSGSRSRRQVLVLDCCHSGAFARGMTTKAAPTVGVGEHLGGEGRVVLTASDAMQYAFEGDRVRGQGVRSVFTRNLVEGLQTGAADRDRDGWVSLDEWYDYVYEQVTITTPNQQPAIWAFGVQGDIAIAKAPRPMQQDDLTSGPSITASPSEPGPSANGETSAPETRETSPPAKPAADIAVEPDGERSGALLPKAPAGVAEPVPPPLAEEEETTPRPGPPTPRPWWHRRGVLAVLALGAVTAAVLLWPRPGPLAFDGVRVNFQPPGFVTPSGWQADIGEPFGPRPGGSTYGWVRAGTGEALDVSSRMRDRDRPGLPPELDTLVHMDLADPQAGIVEPAVWELQVPEGRYRVTVSVGDAAFARCCHSVRVEGTVAVAPFENTAERPTLQATVEVGVRDGRLTIDSNSQPRTKLHYVEVEEAT